MILIREFIDEYGYHSDKELDLTYKCYYEEVENIIFRVKNYVLDKEYNIENRYEEEQLLKYNKQIENIKSKKIKKEIDDMRRFLWYREDLKDLSIRYYCLMRKYTNKLAEKYEEENILNKKEDIYYLTQEDIIKFINKKINKREFNEIIQKNKIYYNSFRNFENPTDIGKMYKEPEVNKKECQKLLQGIGGNDKIVTGKVRVINDVKDINKLKQDEILVTKYIDTGWTSRFGILKGVISEYGGVLCHSSIVAREYGISVIVCAKDICKHLNTGDIIQMNGNTGEIKLLEEYKNEKNI